MSKSALPSENLNDDFTTATDVWRNLTTVTDNIVLSTRFFVFSLDAGVSKHTVKKVFQIY